MIYFQHQLELKAKSFQNVTFCLTYFVFYVKYQYLMNIIKVIDIKDFFK